MSQIQEADPNSYFDEAIWSYKENQSFLPTIGVNTAVTIDFSPLPTLCTGEDHKFMLTGETVNEYDTFYFNSTHIRPTFDKFSDLDSEDESVSENKMEVRKHTKNSRFAKGEGDSTKATPVNSRGRKQPLTEDLSKTFICNVCNRRFGRREHLKRHYRSLHTQ
jgi:hypothetical protein